MRRWPDPRIGGLVHIWYIKFAPCWELSLQYLWFVSTILSKLMECHLESDFRVLGHDGVTLNACSRSPEVVLYSDIHCLQTIFLIFKFCQPQNKRIFFSRASKPLVGTLMTIGDLTMNIAMNARRVKVLLPQSGPAVDKMNIKTPGFGSWVIEQSLV